MGGLQWRDLQFSGTQARTRSYGHIFRTTCDTEVIVNGYKQWGDGLFDRLNGMFGLAIWDVRRKRLLLVRDPFGIKPLYYKIEKDTVYFGSEIRAVLAAPGESGGCGSDGTESVPRIAIRHRRYTIYSGIRNSPPER